MANLAPIDITLVQRGLKPRVNKSSRARSTILRLPFSERTSKRASGTRSTKVVRSQPHGSHTRQRSIFLIQIVGNEIPQYGDVEVHPSSCTHTQQPTYARSGLCTGGRDNSNGFRSKLDSPSHLQQFVQRTFMPVDWLYMEFTAPRKLIPQQRYI